MFAPRLRSALRPLSRQCLRQHRKNTFPRNNLLTQLRQQQRHSSGSSAFEGAKQLFRAQPFATTLAFSVILAGFGFVVYTNYFYQNYIIGAFHKYPESVAKELRKALYYTNMSLEPANALKYYKKALHEAEEIGMDPFSDEIMGVKIQMSALFEKCDRFDMAINVLEIVKKDNLAWMDLLGEKEGNEEKRTRVLRKTVAVSVKLGDLYAGPHIMEKEKAEECLVWAVETVLREQRRREKEGGGVGEWLPAEEIGASFEMLAHRYEEKDQFYLAAPLFLQALAQSPPSSCHSATLMNNLAICLAQQVPPSIPGQPPTPRAALVGNARQWALKAIEISTKIQPPSRTEECDVGCASATYNLGEFAEMDGDIREARRRFEEAKSLSKAIGYKEGIDVADVALERIGKLEK